MTYYNLSALVSELKHRRCGIIGRTHLFTLSSRFRYSLWNNEMAELGDDGTSNI